jgi:tetratricopeptide (TPR) repeat protein
LAVTEINAVRSLASSLHDLAEIQRERGSASCVDGYRQALSLAESIQDAQAARIYSFKLGNAYEALGGIRDLALAELWYQRALTLCAEEDRMGRARCLGQLGSVAYRRFRDARKTSQRPEEYVGHLSRAEQHCMQALELFPKNAVRELAPTHNQLGNIYGAADQIDAALHHYREAIRYSEAMQDPFAAGQTRYNAAATLSRAGRFADARDWAQSALRDFQACENAEQEIVTTLKLMELIESDLRSTSPPS